MTSAEGAPEAAAKGPPEGIPLWAALESGVADLERALARLGQGVALVGTAVAAWFTFIVARPTGAVLLAATVGVFVMYTLVHEALARGVAVRALRLAIPVLEVAVPLGALALLVRTEGPAYALGSWVPPQLLTIFLAGSILRLDARIPVLMGAAAAVGYLGVWWWLIHGQVDETVVLQQPSVQLVRATALLLTGAACSGAVLGLRRAIGAAARELRARDLFGKYQLGRVIASGGMGRVFEAVYCPEGGFHRRVAVKLVHPHLARDPEFVRRFRTEAELASMLAHPNVVTALDFGRVDDTYFLAMEYVDGRTLADVMAERRRSGRALSPKVVAFIGIQVARALQYAHEDARDEHGDALRVVHRDLTPSNIMVDRSGRVRITDFGVARALGSSEQLLTTTLVGKPSYVAPEALHGAGIDPRSDLWSLAVVMWEAVANQRLFLRDNDAAALHAVLQGPIPAIDTLRPGLFAHWAPFFGRALARDRAQRFSTAREMRDALAVIASHEGVVSPEEMGEVVMVEDGLEELPLDASSEDLAQPAEAGGAP